MLLGLPNGAFVQFVDINGVIVTLGTMTGVPWLILLCPDRRPLTARGSVHQSARATHFRHILS